MDIETAMIGQGKYELAQDYSRFKTDRYAWAAMTEDEVKKTMSSFVKYCPKLQNWSVSTDKKTVVPVTPSAGKKPGQRTRKRATRTTPNSRKRIRFAV